MISTDETDVQLFRDLSDARNRPMNPVERIRQMIQIRLDILKEDPTLFRSQIMLLNSLLEGIDSEFPVEATPI